MKKTLVVLLGVTLFATACEDEPNNNPSGTPAIFTAALTTAAERPVPTTELSCAGTVTITLNLTQNQGGPITAATADFQTSITGCPNTTQITLAHIHDGPVDVIGPIVVNTGVSSGQVVLTNGAGSFSRTGISVDPSLAQQLLDTPAEFYFNVHSQANGPGIIRGQLTRTQ